MGTIIKELDKKLVIFKPQDETKTDDDILFINEWDTYICISFTKFLSISSSGFSLSKS